jgi:D-xylulose reductase
VYKIDEKISLEEAVLVEPTSVAVHAVKLADVRPGETVVVMGSGESRTSYYRCVLQQC